MISARMACMSSSERARKRTPWSAPWMRIRGGCPEMRWRSEPFCSSASCRKELIRFTRLPSGPCRHARVDEAHELGASHVACEVAAVGRAEEGLVRIDVSRLDQVQECLVHELHPDPAAGGDGGGELEKLLLANQL